MEKSDFKFSEIDSFDLGKQPAMHWVTLLLMAPVLLFTLWIGWKVGNQAIQESVTHLKWIYGVGSVLCVLYIPIHVVVIIPQFFIRAETITREGVIFKKYGLHRFDDAKSIFVSVHDILGVDIVFKNGRTFFINPNDSRLLPALHLVLDYLESSGRTAEIANRMKVLLKQNQIQGAWSVIVLGLIGLGLSFAFAIIKGRIILIVCMILTVAFGIYRLKRTPRSFEFHLADYKIRLQASRQKKAL